MVGLATLVFATIVVTGQAPPRAPAGPTVTESLAAVFALAGGAVTDVNGDGLADSVIARIVVPARATADDIEAATNIAGRLGYETTSLTLPLVLRDTEVDPAKVSLPILVGRQNALVLNLAERGAIDLKALTPGQGLVALVASAIGGRPAIVVAGGDDAGTLAAGTQLAARVPRLWNMSGMTLGGIEQQIPAYLARHGVAGATARVVALVVDAERRGIASVRVRASVPPAQASRALAVLTELDAAHRRGQEERTLNFAEAAVTIVEVAAAGRIQGEAVVRRSGLNARTLTPPVDPDEYAPEPNAAGIVEPRLAPAKPFDLTTAYSIEGWFGDAYQDLIPDRTETSIIIGEASDAIGAAHIAARLGLETTGMNLPIARRDSKVKEPGAEASPILVGRANTLVQQLVKIGKTRLDDLQPGQGEVHVVPRAFGNATATVVAGADAAGTLAASSYLARRAPYLWDVARGSLTIEDLATDVSRFLTARSGAGQAGQAVQELKAVLDELQGKTIESFDAKLFIEKGDKALDSFLASRIRAAIGAAATATVVSQGVTDAATVFEEKVEIPWEVDDFRAKVRSDVIPKVKPGVAVEVLGRLSEPRQIRDQVAEEMRAELRKAGAADPRVRILSAYKQGFSWLTEEVIPSLKGRNAKAIRIRVAAHRPDLTKKFKFYSVPTRWLHELYPVDELFQRDLGIPTSAFRMELVENASDTYALEALDASGRVILRAAFSPKSVDREYLDKFPGWSRVEVTTGWLTARVGDQVAFDGRIQTDPERCWDHYQAKILPRVYENVIKVTGGKPTADKQPFFRDFDLEVWMSEPDERIGVDEELVSSLEALHEDLYFVTLDFFAAMGRTLTKTRLNAPGKIFPIVHPARAGKPGEARILYAGNAATKAKLDVTYKEKGADKPTTVSRELSRIDTTPPLVLRAVVRDDRVSELELQVEAKDDKEAARAVDALDGLTALHAAGLFKTALSYRPRRSGGRRRGAEGGSDPACREAHGRLGAIERQVRGRGVAGNARHLGPRHRAGRIRAHRRRPGGPSRSPQLQGGRVLPGPRHLGHGAHATHPGGTRVGREADGVQAHHPHHGPPACERGLVDEPHPAARRTARDRPGLQGDPEEGQRRAVSGDEPGRRADGLRPAEADTDVDAARRALQRARHGCHVQGRRPPAGGRGRRAAVEAVAARHLPQSAWISVARVGAAILGLRGAWVPSLLEFARLVHDAEQPARPARARTRRGHRCAARGDRARDQQQRRRPRDEPPAPGPLPALGDRLRASPVRRRGVQGHADLLLRSRNGRTAREPPRGRAAVRSSRASCRDRLMAAGDLHERHDGGA